MRREEWLVLAERCEKATGPDREIASAIARAIGWTFQKMKGDRHEYWRKPGATEYYMRSELPELTNSLDAITSLIERELPHAWSARNGRSGDSATARALLWIDGTPDRSGHGATVALALCAAFCRAMAEKGE